MATERAERRLVAIMFTDIVGYTALMEGSEEKGLRAREKHRTLAKPMVERYGGEWIDEWGDESLSSFPSAVNAVNCALAIQEKLNQEPELRVRIGIHLGDVVLEGGTMHGDGVNVASRIRPLAEPGGVCVSEQVHDSIKSQPNLELRSLGDQRLKNVEKPVAVYGVTGTSNMPATVSAAQPRRAHRTGLWAGSVVSVLVLAIAAWWLNRGVTDLPPIRSIAVLPLENLSGDPEQEYFADGMTEALIGDLAKIGALHVISRTSVIQFKRTEKPLPEIAKELNVDGIIEGTVMRAGGRVRITAQLIDARDDRHIWSNRYDRDLSNVLALQNEVARAVAEQVRLELTPKEQAALTAPRRQVDPRAYDAYLRGLEARGSSLGSFPGLWAPQAIEKFEQAVELDPDFAEGYAALALARSWLALLDSGEYTKAREAAERALELDERLGAAHAVLGQVLLHHEWNFDAARQAYERAVQVSPNDPTALNNHAFYLLMVGRTEEALGVMERLLRVAPFDRFYRGIRVRNFSWAHQYQRALEELERMRELFPGFVDLEVITLYAKLGRLEEAHRAHVALYEQCGPPCDWAREAIERGWSEGGWNSSIRTLLKAAAAAGGEVYSSSAIGAFYALIGETEEAFVWLERSYHERDPLLVLLKSLPAVDPLRSDPRYDDLVRRMGFPES